MTQQSFSRLWGNPWENSTREKRVYQSDDEAKKARDAHYRELLKEGYRAHRETLKGQLRKYWGLGDPCGESCTVYYITIHNA